MPDRIETIREWCVAKRQQAIAAHQPIVDDIEFLLVVIDRVRELHRPVDRGRVQPCCGGCESDANAADCHEWPCPTTAAITGVEGL